MSLNTICLVLGGARRGEFETLSEMGVKLGLILDSNSPGGTPVDHQFALIKKFDFQQSAADLLALIDKISESWRVEAVLNTREAYVSHHSAATRHLGLPSISESALRCVTNKTAMHNAFVEHIGKHSTALFARAKSIEELPEIVSEIGFPLILKPTNLAASLFVQKCDTFDDLLTGFSSMQDSLRAHYEKLGIAESAAPEVQIEEFLSGSLHSQDLIVTEHGEIYPTPIVDVITGKDLGLNDFHHFYRGCPSKLERREHEVAYELAVAGVRALGLKSCIAHVEFIYTENGPKLLEIAARPGAHRNYLLEMTHGISLNVQYYNNQKRQAIDCSIKDEKNFAILTPFPRVKRQFLGLKDVETFKSLPSYRSHEFRVKGGDLIGPAREGHYSCFVLELMADSHEVLWADIETVKEMGDCFL
ncbi:ATP-grasp domain-containing protein [Chromobacterium vaccinii]|uniref:ATP-grasp domain-containing protein n=1 Tax=Chromobacterium vaccinii TaxID=1108595 RepID=UPI001E403421|nr:ATP-grasp domain-containing protein [Chromobacterium vaccinii]MCD4484937.1 ATP-grasp domain-containing protein [Chromobacterium vaccinii]